MEKLKDCIIQDKNTYLLNMRNENIETGTKENNIAVEYGEQDLKQILLTAIKEEYIRMKNNSIITSS